MKLPILTHISCPACDITGFIKWDRANQTYRCYGCQQPLPVKGFSYLVEGIFIMPQPGENSQAIHQGMLDFSTAFQELVERFSARPIFIPSNVTVTEFEEIDDKF